MKLPFKETPANRGCSDEEIQRVDFFKGALQLNDTRQIIVVIRREKLDINDESFVLSLMTIIIKQSTKDIEYEYMISGSKNKISIKKGTWFITVKLLYCQDQATNAYYIPVKANEIKVPLSNTYIPGVNKETTRENYLTYVERSATNESNQISNIYIINDDDLETLRNGVDA